MRARHGLGACAPTPLYWPVDWFCSTEQIMVAAPAPEHRKCAQIGAHNMILRLKKAYHATVLCVGWCKAFQLVAYPRNYTRFLQQIATVSDAQEHCTNEPKRPSKLAGRATWVPRWRTSADEMIALKLDCRTGGSHAKEEQRRPATLKPSPLSMGRC